MTEVKEFQVPPVFPGQVSTPAWAVSLSVPVALRSLRFPVLEVNDPRLVTFPRLVRSPRRARPTTVSSGTRVRLHGPCSLVHGHECLQGSETVRTDDLSSNLRPLGRVTPQDRVFWMKDSVPPPVTSAVVW